MMELMELREWIMICLAACFLAWFVMEGVL